ncbi:MAG: hypothetical protein ABL974_17815 [Prosthecobacter sp.]
MKPEERAQFILSQLNTGLRTEWSQIEGLEASLEKLLQEAKNRADAHIPAANRATWEAAWQAVQDKLTTIHSCAAEARSRLDAVGNRDALEPWNTISAHDRELDALFDTLRVTGREALPGAELEPWYDGWKGLWVSIEDHLATLRAHIIATRFRLEMRQEYGADKADEVTRQILASLPADASLEDAEKYAAEYRMAHHEVEEHREHPTLRDIIRGLFLLPEETPEDLLARSRKARATK